jgi:Trypsin-co-occurring domain 1
MYELLRWQTDDGTVVVETDADDAGFESITRKPGEVIHDVTGKLEEALKNTRSAAVLALKTFRDKAVDPESIELEFGIKLNAEAGAVIARTSAEGHFAVKLTWARPAEAAEAADG